jgi:UDP-N-acetylglucosamine transferase subunit ALG13
LKTKNPQKFNINQVLQPAVLVAPLDWGLGHATRCIPIIKYLLNKNVPVIIAASGPQAILLEKEFPEITILPVKSYNIRYGKTSLTTSLQLLAQLPRLLHTIKSERKWLLKTAEQYLFSAIISDNRYGLHHPTVPSFFITHQLTIKTSFGKWCNVLLRKINYYYINKFTACWVPDDELGENAAGNLSHPPVKPATTLKYLGLLSRMQVETMASKNFILVILSGPEPQRTVFENILLAQMKRSNCQFILVRGLPGANTLPVLTSNIKCYQHADAATLNKLMLQAALIISRCGYSTVMDILALQKKSILVPTPAQTEQEYLARHLSAQAYCITAKQAIFNLEKLLAAVEKTHFKFWPFDVNKFKKVLDETIIK